MKKLLLIFLFVINLYSETISGYGRSYNIDTTTVLGYNCPGGTSPNWYNRISGSPSDPDYTPFWSCNTATNSADLLCCYDYNIPGLNANGPNEVYGASCDTGYVLTADFGCRAPCIIDGSCSVPMYEIDPVCDNGGDIVEGVCVEPCPVGTYRNEFNQCDYTCLSGEIYNTTSSLCETYEDFTCPVNEALVGDPVPSLGGGNDASGIGVCVPDSSTCISGQAFSSLSGCEDIGSSGSCETGYSVTSSGECGGLCSSMGTWCILLDRCITPWEECKIDPMCQKQGQDLINSLNSECIYRSLVLNPACFVDSVDDGSGSCEISQDNCNCIDPVADLNWSSDALLKNKQLDDIDLGINSLNDGIDDLNDDITNDLNDIKKQNDITNDTLSDIQSNTNESKGFLSSILDGLTGFFTTNDDNLQDIESSLNTGNSISSGISAGIDDLKSLLGFGDTSYSLDLSGELIETTSFLSDYYDEFVLLVDGLKSDVLSMKSDLDNFASTLNPNYDFVDETTVIADIVCERSYEFDYGAGIVPITIDYCYVPNMFRPYFYPVFKFMLYLAFFFFGVRFLTKI